MSNHPRRRRRSAPRLAPVPDDPVDGQARYGCAACRGATHEQMDARLLELVASHGHAVQLVEGDVARQSWAYTIGLGHTYGLPELLVAGLRSADAAGLLNRMVEEFTVDGLPAPGRGLQHRVELSDHGHEFCLLTVGADADAAPRPHFRADADILFAGKKASA